MRRPKPKYRTPPVNPDPDKYIVVKTKYGYILRRKRGTVKPAVLNDRLQANTQSMKWMSVAAKRVVHCLERFTREMDTGSLRARLISAWFKNPAQPGAIDLAALNRFEIQADHPLDKLFHEQVTCKRDGERVSVNFELREHSVTVYNKDSSHYYIELVVVSGNPMDDDLEAHSEVSPLFDMRQKTVRHCSLSIDVPKDKPWMVLVRVACLEGRYLAAHPKNYGMRVCMTGGATK